MHTSTLNSPSIKVPVWYSNPCLKPKQPEGLHRIKSPSLLQKSLKSRHRKNHQSNGLGNTNLRHTCCACPLYTCLYVLLTFSFEFYLVGHYCGTEWICSGKESSYNKDNTDEALTSARHRYKYDLTRPRVLTLLVYVRVIWNALKSVTSKIQQRIYLKINLMLG